MLVGRGQSSAVLYNALAEAFPIGAVICEEKVGARVLLRRRMKRLGLGVVAGQLGFKAAVLPVVRCFSRRRARQIIWENRLNTAAIPEDTITPVVSVNSEPTIATLERLAPRVVVVNGTRIIDAKTLKCVDAVFINTHVGITPLYRGVHGGYWALASDDARHCGVTVHRVDTGIDTGSIIAQATIQPTREDTFATYPLLQMAAAIPLVKQAVCDALAGTLSYRPAPEGTSRLWSHPTAWQYIKTYVARGVR